MASGHGRVFTVRLRFVRFGRKATKHVRSLHFCFWLLAEVRMAAIFVCFTSSSGNSDAEFPLLEALRTPKWPRPISRQIHPVFGVERTPEVVTNSATRRPSTARAKKPKMR